MARPISEIGVKGFRQTHGMTNTKAHKIWSGMIDRCRPDNKRYAKNYADRGITVCDEWKEFENFYADMGPPPAGLSLDRIDVNGSYCKENCRWADNKTQQNNRQNTRIVSVNGHKMPLMELAVACGVKKSAAQYFYSTLKILQKNGLTVTISEK